MFRRWSIVTCILGIFACAGLLSQPSLAADPAVRREAIEWCDIWVPNATQNDLPRVLLIGDSICKGYYDIVSRELKDKAYVAKFASSAAVEDPVLASQLAPVLTNYKFAVVHFNVGLHGMDYTDEEYQKDFPKLLEVIRKHASGAKLIWATSTPMRKPAPNLQEFATVNERVKARNKIVVDLVGKERIPLDDLYGLVENHPEYWLNDGVHHNFEGVTVLGKQVTKAVLDSLAK